MKKRIGVGLILVALFAGYMGMQSLNNSGASVNIMGIKISAQDEGAKQSGFIYLGLAAIALIGGVRLLRRE